MTQARVERNTTRILDAAVDVAAETGWGNFTLHAVAGHAGLSMRAAQSRAADREELAVLTWRERCAPALGPALADALTAAGLLDAPADEAAFIRALDRFARPDPALQASVELLIASQFADRLAAAVGEEIGHEVDSWCRPGRRAGAASLGARRAFVVILSLGLLAASRHPGAGALDLSGDLARQFAALQDPAAPSPLPAERPPMRRRITDFGTGDPIHEALLASTLDQVGQLGYEAATTRRIAQAAGVSETTIFLRHATKLSLFIEATDRQLARVYRANAEYEQQLEEQYGEAIASAVTTRESLRPDVALQRAIYLEQVRMSWHDKGLMERQVEALAGFIAQLRAERLDGGMAATEARAHLAYATGLGIPLLPILAPRAWSLPFDVVTLPLTQRG